MQQERKGNKELGFLFFLSLGYTSTPSNAYKEFSVEEGKDSLLPSVLQVIYCINQPASVKCMGSDYTIIHNTISMKHLSRPIHQSLIQ